MTKNTAYIIEGDKVLISSSPINNDNQHSVTPAIFSLPKTINGINVSDIVYQVEGMVRLTQDMRNDSNNDKNDNESLADFAMSRQCAETLGIVTAHGKDSDNILYFDDQNQAYQLTSFRTMMSTVDSIVLDGISQSIQRLNWHSEHTFCCKCGVKTRVHEVFSAVVCTDDGCHHTQYTQIQPCVITAVTRQNPDNGKTQILLANHHRYGDNHNTNQMYGLIAGFVEVGESLEHAVQREVDEEVGLNVDGIQYFSSQPWPYPSNLMVGFTANYVSGDIVIQEDELTHADFFDIDNLPKTPPLGSIAYRLIEHVINQKS